jgi:hypothetical protein
MSRGGKRQGAGRKKSALTKRTQEIAAKASKDGITPLEVMLENMRFAHVEAQRLAEMIAGEGATIENLKGLLDMRKIAEECAKDAAPYVHPRLQAVQHSGPGGGPIQQQLTRIERVVVDPENPDA